MPSGTDRYWFHGADNWGDAQRIYNKYSKFAEMTPSELRAHIQNNWNGDYAAFQNDYNNHVNSHYRFKDGKRRKHGTNPFDANPQAKLDLEAVSADWHYEKGQDVSLKPLESIFLGTTSDFIKESASNRYSKVLKNMLGQETLNIHKGGFKPVEEFTVNGTQPVKEYQNTLKQRASGEKPVDTGENARKMLSALARRGVSGVSSETASSSMERLAKTSTASNSRQQTIDNIKYRDDARKNLMSLTTDLIKFNTERKQDLQAQFGETVTGLAQLSAINAGYDEMRTLNNTPFSHMDRKKD